MVKLDKWEILGYVFAVTNPIIPGILMGIMLYMEKKYKSTGRNVIILSLIMTVLYLYIISLSIPRVP